MYCRYHGRERIKAMPYLSKREDLGSYFIEWTGDREQSK